MPFSDLGSLLRGPPRSASHRRHRLLLSHVSTSTAELRSSPATRAEQKIFGFLLARNGSDALFWRFTRFGGGF
ncbi:hypothetical protein ACFX1Z_018487 [Malus domestica]